MKPWLLTTAISSLIALQAFPSEWNTQTQQAKYHNLLLFQPSDNKTVATANSILQKALLPEFESAVEAAKNFVYELEGQPAYFDFKVFPEDNVSPAKKAQDIANKKLTQLISDIIPTLAYAYQTPGANPYYHNKQVLQLYIKGIEYTYSRGLTERAWTPDHAARASKSALKKGLTRSSGDFSGISLHFGGYIQSIFLMRQPLEQANLLDKYRQVARNLAVNSGVMYPVFSQVARTEAGIDYNNTVSKQEAYLLNADGMRLFVDYFWPYFLLIEDQAEHQRMTHILKKVIAVNIAPKSGTQDTIKPDGVGFHHSAAYVGAYSPYAIEAMAQLLYLLSDTDFYTQHNVNTLKLAIESFRIMAQKYSVSPALSGRIIANESTAPAIAISKAMCLLATPQGFNDPQMQKRFLEFFDPTHFFSDQHIASYYKGKRGVPIRGLGIYRLISHVQNLNTTPAKPPAGTWIKPYAASAFHRRDHWLVTAHGFSQYFWDYEGPLNKHQNSFGQNWAYGLLQVFSAGNPVSALDSGYDLDHGWDWYHIPGTTASHYPVEKRSEKKVAQARQAAGIQQRSIHRNYNSKTFVGGVSLGNHGLFVQDLEAIPFTSPTDLYARKSYFFVGNKVLALGSHISGGTAQDETHTTLFQTKLRNPKTTTSLNGKQLQDLNTFEQLPANQTASMTDSVGNSYYLADNSAELVVRRNTQQSMTPQYKPTTGDYAQAWINHGIKPRNDHYQYVVIPADKNGHKLKRLADDPAAYYQVLKSDPMHLVYFPKQQITAYAFYERVETPDQQLVKTSNLHATVMTQKRGANINLAASVPDIGWQTNPQELQSLGLGYASKHYTHQEAKTHKLQLTLRGKWKLIQAAPSANLSLNANETHLQLSCKDGLTQQVTLAPAE